jgi:hypothetical protein
MSSDLKDLFTERMYLDINKFLCNARIEPITVLGRGAADLAHKVANKVHIKQLQSPDAVCIDRRRWGQRHSGTDQGIERSVAAVPHLPIDDLDALKRNLEEFTRPGGDGAVHLANVSDYLYPNCMETPGS